ncbi:hypothetical protein At1D1609_19360 [Agrobacterium tumefaciens]|uniref:Uncharacterized protein n=1 Tax=Agrobacterium tumefaciens TaxID=358 RepID=A0A2L2LCC2_AGRTU|nr:hypothetical protein At1D1609_19360 [Agrobacterium tumefaciens]
MLKMKMEKSSEKIVLEVSISIGFIGLILACARFFIGA